MGRSIWVLAVALGVTLGAGRAMVPPVPPSAADAPPPEATGGWRATATDADKQRIRGWYKSWQAALADARAKGFGADIDREGVLLQRSEEHTSELQSLMRTSYAVFCLKKNKYRKAQYHRQPHN